VRRFKYCLRMKFHPPKIDQINGQILTRRTFLSLGIWIGLWTTISLLIYIKIPTAFTKVYAEDGLALQIALKKSFPDDFLLPYAGYFDVVWRSGGRVAALFPLENAAQTIFLFNTLMLSWITLILFRASSEFIPSRISRSIFSLSLVLLPIASFESIANTTNLHFFFMSACLPIFLRKSTAKHETYFFSFFVLIASLSTPLMIFYFPLIIYLRWGSKNSKRFEKLKLAETALLVGIFLQVIFILTRALGDRTSTGVNSIAKTSYLYLDRVIGSTFFPWWGNVSENTSSIAPNLFSTQIYLSLRALFAFVLLFLFLLYLFKLTTKNKELKVLAMGVFLSGLFYWLVVGMLFNPEPRYAIFPSFGLLLLMFYTQGAGSEIGVSKIHQPALVLVILLTWIGTWSPSELRVGGPTWITEYRNAQATCLTQGGEVRIPIIPINMDWVVIIDCTKMLSS